MPRQEVTSLATVVSWLENEGWQGGLSGLARAVAAFDGREGGAKTFSVTMGYYRLLWVTIGYRWVTAGYHRLPGGY